MLKQGKRYKKRINRSSLIRAAYFCERPQQPNGESNDEQFCEAHTKVL
jgi:hypothetical protein